MLVHVLHVRIRGLFKAAFVAKSRLQEDVSTPTTIVAGVVVKSAKTSCLVGSIAARGHVTRDYVVPVKSESTLDVTAGKWKSQLFAANVETRRTVREHLKMMTTSRWWNSGRGCSTAKTHVRGPTTAASTFVRSSVIHKNGSRPTALDRLTWCHIVLVERHCFHIFPALYAHLAKIRFAIAQRNVQEGCPAAIRAGRSATPVNACLV